VRIPALSFGRRQQAVLALAAATGIVVGLVVVAFERVTDAVVLDALLDGPSWFHVVGPGLGLFLAAVLLGLLGRRTSSATADEYVRAFHDRHGRLSLIHLPARMLAGVATIGLGGALGLEGPSIYAGASAGSAIQHRVSRLFRRDEAKVLLVAGAAAGVAAVFKAPATGVVFALEVPYRDDIAPHALGAALVAAATSYLTFVTLVGPEPLFRVLGGGSFAELEDLGGAVVVGVLAGSGARLFAAMTRRAKVLGGKLPFLVRMGIAAALLGLLAVAADVVFDEPLTLGPGYEVLRWIADPEQTLPLIALLFAMRLVATTTVIGGGGVGGIFIPLAIQGALLGRFVAGVVGEPDSSLYPVIGIAAFLGAGYRTPVASVMFVAETTGRAAFVVPALVAAAVSQLIMGASSVSATQQSARTGHLERRFRLPISTAVRTDVLTIPPDATVAEFVWVHAIGQRERSVPVVEGARYVGMCRLEAAAEIARDEWERTPVSSVMRTDLPVAQPSWLLRDVIAAMEEADVDRLPVADASGSFIGVVLSSEILKLDEILEETGG